jgi:hypothetical protein
MRKLLNTLATTIVVLSLLSLFGWSVRHHAAPGKHKGWWGTVVDELVSLPDLLTRAKEEVQRLPETFVRTPKSFVAVNELVTDLNILESYTDASNDRAVQIRNLRNDQILHRWTIKGYYPPHHRVVHPLALPDTSLVYCSNGEDGIYRIDKNGDELWHQGEVGMHHALNMGPDNTLWLCGYDLEQTPRALNGVEYELGGQNVRFTDNFVVGLDVQTGELVHKQSVAQLLQDNGLEYLIFKSVITDDPIHLNDVQPVISSGPYMQSGDLWLSFRTSSVVLQYRPSTGKIIRVVEGPFQSQHDVDIVNDSTIAIFNNNAPTKRLKEDPKRDSEKRPRFMGNFSSHIVHYDLAKAHFDAPNKAGFAANGIFTFTEGLFEYLPDGTTFVEAQNEGVLWVIDGSKVIYRGVLPSPHEGYHHLTNWARPVFW